MGRLVSQTSPIDESPEENFWKPETMCFYDRYIEECEGSSLEEDADPLADEWDDGILSSVRSLAIRRIRISAEEAKD